MRFREHRGTMVESLRTTVHFEGRDALVAIVQDRLASIAFEPEDLEVSLYIVDTISGWNSTHVVTLKGYGVAGFTDGAL